MSRWPTRRFSIGPPPAAESYLVIDKIVAACKQSGAEAVHPGYGFLSEREAFPKALQKAGIVFIGPNPKAIARHGRQDRVQESGRRGQGLDRARPSRCHRETTIEAIAIAEQIGYPVMIKASAGGGGKGMRIAYSQRPKWRKASRAPARRRNRRSATTACSSRNSSSIRAMSRSRCWATSTATSSISASANARSSAAIRKWSRKRRRRCSMKDTRKKMGEQAVALAKAVGYDSAGTVEFVAGQDKSFFFLEMNTRLQVEHPVTELVTGIDLVEQMIRSAAGEKLVDQAERREAQRLGGGKPRLCRRPVPQFPALDRAAHALPPAGRARDVRGVTVRNDTGVYEGGEISLFYDPDGRQAGHPRRRPRAKRSRRRPTRSTPSSSTASATISRSSPL